MSLDNSLSRIYISRPGTSLTAARSRRHGLSIRRVTSAGCDRYMAGPREVHDHLHPQIQPLTGDTGKTFLHDAATRGGAQIRHSITATAPCRSSIQRRRGQSPPPPQPRWDSAGRFGSRPRPQARTRPAAQCQQNGEEPAGMHGLHQPDEQSGARVTGQNGRGSAKRAVIRTASLARTLSAICTWTLPCIDPQ